MPLLPLFAALLSVPTPLSLPVPTATQNQRELVDEEYRFRLRARSGWQLLTGDQATELNPDALAGLTGGGVWGAIIAELAPGVTAADFARVLIDNIEAEARIEDLEVVSFDELEFQERSAVRYRLEGKVAGIDLFFENTVYMNGDFAFQVFAWAPVDAAGEGGSALATVHESFTILKGEVAGRRSTQVTEDVRGVGWQVRGGVFESAAYGIRVAPSSPWRVAVADELFGMSEDAEVGLVSSLPDAYITLTPERLIGIDHEDYAETLRLGFGGEEMELQGEPIELAVGGEAVRFDRYDFHSALPLRFLYGVQVSGTVVTEIQIWFGAALEERALALIEKGLGAVQYMEEPERTTLRAELARLGDPEVSIREGFSLRAGTLRDFDNGLVWRKPEGLWRTTTGELARAESDDYRLLLEEPDLGVHGVLEVRPWDGDDLAFAHANSLVEEWRFFDSADDAPDARELQLGAAQALASQVRAPWDEADPTYSVITALHQGRRFELSFYGEDANMIAASAAIDAVARGLEFQVDGPVPSRFEEGVYVDERVGYSLRAPAQDWTASTDQLPAFVRPLGSSCGWTGPERAEVFTFGIHVEGSSGDGSTVERVLLNALAGRLGRRKEERAGTFLGEPCRILTLRRLRQVTEIAVLQRHGLVFLVGVSSRGSGPTLEEAEALFAFRQ